MKATMPQNAMVRQLAQHSTIQRRARAAVLDVRRQARAALRLWLALLPPGPPVGRNAVRRRKEQVAAWRKARFEITLTGAACEALALATTEDLR